MNQHKFPFALPTLPYAQDALDPYISSSTLSFHYGKHHQTYVTNLNNLIKDSDLSKLSLENIIMETYNKSDSIAIFNNAAQVWNHSFYWYSMKQNGGGAPIGNLASAINSDFGNYDNFKTAFINTSIGQFGSGWAWIVWDYQEKKLKITKTSNAELPMTSYQKAILTIDVWEHSYYLDYQNRRLDYINVFLNHLVDWNFAEENFNNINTTE